MAVDYARRYSLFTLVGIAGEDDLDAPDLVTPTSSLRNTGQQRRGDAAKGRLDAAPHQLAARTSLAAQHATGRNGGRHPFGGAAVIMDLASSGRLRDQMLSEVNEIGTSDQAAKWARRRLAEKNKLDQADARHIEESFRAKLLSFAIHHSEGVPPSTESPAHSRPPTGNPRQKAKKQAADGVDKSLLAHPEPRRVRDREHVRFVAQQPCLVCGRQPADAHHLRFAQNRALGRKVSDEFTVPLCRGHHREVHRHGDEQRWWRRLDIDPAPAARALLLQTHPSLQPSQNGNGDKLGTCSGIPSPNP